MYVEGEYYSTIYVHTSFQEVAEFIPLIMTTITLQPTPAQRSHKDFNKEVFADFVHAQVRSSSILILRS